MAGRCAAIRDCGATKLAGYLRMLYVEHLPAAAVYNSLTTGLTRAFKNGSAFKSAMDYQLKKLNAEVTDDNADAVASSIVLVYGRAAAGGEAAHRSLSRSRSPPRRAGGAAPAVFIPCVTARPNPDIYQVILEHAPSNELRVPPSRPDARDVSYARFPHPTERALDVVQVSICVLSKDAVATLMQVHAGAREASPLPRPPPPRAAGARAIVSDDTASMSSMRTASLVTSIERAAHIMGVDVPVHSPVSPTVRAVLGLLCRAMRPGADPLTVGEVAPLVKAIVPTALDTFPDPAATLKEADLARLLLAVIA